MSETDWPSSLQIVASKRLGGAEQWAQRFAVALAEQQADATVAVRAGSEVAEMSMGGLPMRELPFRTVWDPISRHAVARLVRELSPDVVQTYTGRATRLTHLPPVLSIWRVSAATTSSDLIDMRTPGSATRAVSPIG